MYYMERARQRGYGACDHEYVVNVEKKKCALSVIGIVCCVRVGVREWKANEGWESESWMESEHATRGRAAVRTHNG